MAETRFIHGFHAVAARLRHDPESILELHVAAQRGDARARDLLAKAEAAGVRIMPTDSGRLDGMAGTHRHQGVVAKIDPRHKVLHLEDVLDNLTENALILVLDGITDPHNLGACLRVADAAGAHAVIAPKDRACGLNADGMPFIVVEKEFPHVVEVYELDPRLLDITARRRIDYLRAWREALAVRAHGLPLPGYTGGNGIHQLTAPAWALEE